MDYSQMKLDLTPNCRRDTQPKYSLSPHCHHRPLLENHVMRKIASGNIELSSSKIAALQLNSMKSFSLCNQVRILGATPKCAPRSSNGTTLPHVLRQPCTPKQSASSQTVGNWPGRFGASNSGMRPFAVAALFYWPSKSNSFSGQQNREPAQPQRPRTERDKMTRLE